MSDMIERVGTALAKACMEQFGSTWPNDVKLRFARAAIEAMREPDEEMIDAGVRADWGGTLGSRVAISYRDMIDAALSQDTHSPSPLNPPADEEGAAANSQEQKP